MVVYLVDVNFLPGCYLDALVSIDEVNGSLDIDLMIGLPEEVPLFVVVDLAEEHYRVRGPNNECLVVNQVHLAQVLVCDLLELVVDVLLLVVVVWVYDHLILNV